MSEHIEDRVNEKIRKLSSALKVMSDTKHTRGPWGVKTHRLSDNTRGGAINVTTEDGNVVAFNVFVRDAALIAAAPDLLAAARAMAEIMPYYHKGEAPGHLDACENPDCCGHCKAMRLYRAAIAKATGSESE